MQYFYDKQIRRYVQQFLRLFNNFSIQMGHNEAGLEEYQRVPVRYASRDRMTEAILKQNSENIINTVPIMVGYIDNIAMAPEMRMYQNHEEKIQVFEKKFNHVTDSYEDEVGKTYTVERHMPTPYKLTMNLDLWSSNMDQKLQMLEQIMVIFNPTLNIKSSNNPLDWSSLTYVSLVTTSFSSRTIPIGTEDSIDIATLGFEVPIFINPPAKIRKQTIIHTILNDLDVVATGELDEWILSNPIYDADNQAQTWVPVSFDDFHAKIDGTTVQLLGKDLKPVDSNNDPLKWEDLLKTYGQLQPGISQLRFRKTTDPADTSADIVGNISINSGDDNLLDIVFDTDTYPATTLTSITGIVDPQVNYPGDGTLAAATLGDRVLVLTDVPQITEWSSVDANKDDIIEYNGSAWVLSFDSSADQPISYVLNNADSSIYEWTGVFKTAWVDSNWINAIEGTYKPSYWRIYL